MKRLRRRASEPGVNLNMTTMVDVLFQLLIFFLVLSELKKSSVLVDLPEVSKSEEERNEEGRGDEHPLVITIDARNAIYVDDAPIASMEALKPVLEERLKSAGEDRPTVILRTDQESKGARLVEVVSVLSEVGCRSVTFDVAEKSQP